MYSSRLVAYLYVTSICVLFVFFKQKTAYEMRISDWSSDVCSSDLHIGVATCDDPDIAMKLQRPLAELAHLSQHGEATLCLCGRRQLAQRFQAEPHGQRIRIEAVVDQREPLQQIGRAHV